MNASPRILIIRLSSLGDILHALPAFADLRESFPNARIDWLVGEKCRSLFIRRSRNHAIHVLDADALLHSHASGRAWRQLWMLVQNLRAQHYDFSLDFQD